MPSDTENPLLRELYAEGKNFIARGLRPQYFEDGVAYFVVAVPVAVAIDYVLAGVSLAPTGFRAPSDREVMILVPVAAVAC